uniref:BGGP Beta-1-3-galactosyl-O-glycosyl-glycoprotein n=1 Tax=Physcomitrium patens TaxID=3218 RepID=A0A7I4CWP7_PHYPA
MFSCVHFPIRSRLSQTSQKARDGMKKLMQIPLLLAAVDRKGSSPLLASVILSIVLLLLATLHLGYCGYHSRIEASTVGCGKAQNVREIANEAQMTGLTPPPKLAYLILGAGGDGLRMQRMLQALYHPHNYYLLHLDRESSEDERKNLDRYVKHEQVFQEAGNVYMVAKPNLVTYKGSTMIAATLHGAAILLKKAKDWDWFINLSASDYPLLTQDDLLHVFSYLPKDLNFLEHTNDLGWKEEQRVKPIIIDPALYQNTKTDVYWVTEKRAVPTAFRLFTGSAWIALSRAFMEHTIMGWDNLPRTVLMYYANFVSSPEGYFHTVICNSEEFRNTTVNHDLHFIAWDTPPKQHPISLTVNFFEAMTTSGAPFARKFDKDDPVLNKIDAELLNRTRDGFSPGGWCVGSHNNPCSVRGDYSVLRPGPGARRELQK